MHSACSEEQISLPKMSGIFIFHANSKLNRLKHALDNYFGNDKVYVENTWPVDFELV